MDYRFLRFPDGKAKAVTFSYDDGNRSDLRLSQLFDRYGLKGTFNLNNNVLESPSERTLCRDDVLTLLDAGHEIAVHGARHKAPGKCTPLEGIRDILENRSALEKAFGRIIRGMAYPDSGINCFDNGANYESIRRYLQDLDIVYARSIEGDNDSFSLPQDWYNWTPTAHHANPQIEDYMASFLAIDVDRLYVASRSPRLFFVWGHSWEFDQNHNWDLAEHIYKTLSGHQDVWYATNMDIYKYVSAYNSLVFSADSRMVYNPSLLTIWFNVDGALYSIAPGQTIQL